VFFHDKTRRDSLQISISDYKPLKEKIITCLLNLCAIFFPSTGSMSQLHSASKKNINTVALEVGGCSIPYTCF